MAREGRRVLVLCCVLPVVSGRAMGRCSSCPRPWSGQHRLPAA